MPTGRRHKKSKALFSPANYVRNQLSSLCPHQHQFHPPLLVGTTILPVPAVDLHNRPGLASTASLPTPPSPTWWTDSHHTADSRGAVGQIGAESPNIEHGSQSSSLPKATLCPRTKQAVSSAQLESTYGPIWKLDYSSAMGTSTQDFLPPSVTAL